MRSQMAEGLLRADLGDKIEVFSAGISPSFVHPEVINVLDEIDIDIREHRSKSVSEFLEMPLDLVITLCDHAATRCPKLPKARKQINKFYPDPTGAVVFDDFEVGLETLRDRMRSELAALVRKELNL